MTIRLYLDEDADVALAAALRQRGIEVLTTQEAGHLGLPAVVARTIVVRRLGSLSGHHMEAVRQAVKLALLID